MELIVDRMGNQQDQQGKVGMFGECLTIAMSQTWLMPIGCGVSDVLLDTNVRLVHKYDITT